MNTYRLLACAALALFALAAPARAQTQQPLVDENALRAFVSQQVAGNGGAATRFDVKLGTVETGSLALCRRTEAFAPPNSRFWGRSSVGLRCVDGAGWTVLVPVTVTVWGNALVAANPLSAGSLLAEQDIREQEIELTREPANLPRDAKLLSGQTLTRNVNPGQAIRADMLKTTAVINAGDPVRLRIAGPGFAVQSAGQALGAAGEGQSVRVRTDLGKILLGVARQGRVVDVAL